VSVKIKGRLLKALARVAGWRGQYWLDLIRMRRVDDSTVVLEATNRWAAIWVPVSGRAASKETYAYATLADRVGDDDDVTIGRRSTRIDRPKADVLESGDRGTTHTVEVARNETAAEWPLALDAMLPDSEPAVVIEFDSRALRRVVKAVADIGGNREVRIEIRGHHDPIVIRSTAQCHPATALLCPLSQDDGAKIPQHGRARGEP
jgi:hypothetical protein